MQPPGKTNGRLALSEADALEQQRPAAWRWDLILLSLVQLVAALCLAVYVLPGVGKLVERFEAARDAEVDRIRTLEQVQRQQVRNAAALVYQQEQALRQVNELLLKLKENPK